MWSSITIGGGAWVVWAVTVAKPREAAFEMMPLKRKDLFFAPEIRVREGRRSDLRLQVAIFGGAAVYRLCLLSVKVFLVSISGFEDWAIPVCLARVYV